MATLASFGPKWWAKAAAAAAAAPTAQISIKLKSLRPELRCNALQTRGLLGLPLLGIILPISRDCPLAPLAPAARAFAASKVALADIPLRPANAAAGEKGVVRMGLAAGVFVDDLPNDLPIAELGAEGELKFWPPAL